MPVHRIISRQPRGRRALVAGVSWAASQLALATGGHHAVDDAGLLDPGQCQVELWAERHAEGRRLQHLGPTCRWAGLEWGLNLDRWQDTGARGTDLGLQAKTARAWGEHCSVGGVVSLTWADAVGAGRRLTGAGLLLPLSCQRGDTGLHLNLGRDVLRGAPDAWRGGVAVEQGLGQAWQLMAEAWREPGATRWRAGLRWSHDKLSIDLGRQQRFGARAAAVWTLGINLVLDTTAPP